MAARDPADEVIRFRLNGASVAVAGPGTRPLGPVLREERGLTGIKLACEDGSCGLCSILVDGETVRSCSYPLSQAHGRVVVTVEGLHAHATLNRIQRAFLKWGVPQCGFCAPAMLAAATELVGTRARPSLADIRKALSGVVCRCAGYGRFVAAVAEAVGEVEMPRPPPPGEAIGHDVPSLQGVAKVTGGLPFAADSVPSDALWLRVVPARRAPARLSFGSFAPLMARYPDLLLVLTASDLPATFRAGMPLLAEGRTSLPGEPVCALVGSRMALAALADTPLPIHYEPLAREAHAVNGDQLAAAEVRHGAPETAFAAAGPIAEGQFTFRPFAPAPVEAEAGWAEKRQGGLDLHLALSEGGPERRLLAEALNLPLEQVRIVPPAKSGRFGAHEMDRAALLLGLAAFRLERPVALLVAAKTGVKAPPELRVRARLAADVEGRLMAAESESTLATGTPLPTAARGLESAFVAGLAAQGAAGPYALDAARGSAHAFADGAAPLRRTRGLGAVETTIWREALIDDLAAALGLDRLEIRRRNAPAAGTGLAACLEALAPHWRQMLDQGPASKPGVSGEDLSRVPRHNLRRGVGIGVAGGALDLGAAPADISVKIVLERSGGLSLSCDCEEAGQGISTALVQVAADTLGLSMTAFRFVAEGVRASCGPQAFGAGACDAAARAAAALKRKLLDLSQAGPKATLALTGGMLRVSEGQATREIALAGLPANAAGAVAEARAHVSASAVPAFAAHLAEVELDEAQGTVRLLRVVAAHDLGRVIHPGQVAGQIEGAIGQALGYAVMAVNAEKPGAAGPWSPIPRLNEMPAVEISILPHAAAEAAAMAEASEAAPPTALGAKIIGPWAAAAAAAAILNAIRHATGLALREIPAVAGGRRAALAATPAA